MYILYLNKKKERKREEREGKGGEGNTVIPARPSFQEKVKRPVPRTFCKWWTKGHGHLALTAERERRSGGWACPSFLPSHHRPPPWRTESGTLESAGCVTLGMLFAFSGP